jgi:hypothetical protein
MTLTKSASLHQIRASVLYADARAAQAQAAFYRGRIRELILKDASEYQRHAANHAAAAMVDLFHLIDNA